MSRSLGVLAAVAILAGCSRSTPDVAPLRAKAPNTSAHPRIAVIVMENKEYATVMRDPRAGYLRALAERSALATSFYATTHPSLPNYLVLTGGQTFGITSNCTDCSVAGASLVDQFEAAGISWKAYIEGLPGPCSSDASSAGYAKKHNPFFYYDRITQDPARCSKVVPSTELTADLARGALPDFTWITPDLCHDTHDCDVGTGDRFLSAVVPALQKALGKGGILFITYDEGTTSAGCCSNSAGGHIVTVVTGSGARPGTYPAPFTHRSIVRAIEDRWRLPHLGTAGTAPSMDAMLRPG